MSYVLQQKRHTYINYDINHLADFCLPKSECGLASMATPGHQGHTQLSCSFCLWRVSHRGAVFSTPPHETHNINVIFINSKCMQHLRPLLFLQGGSGISDCLSIPKTMVDKASIMLAAAQGSWSSLTFYLNLGSCNNFCLAIYVSM